jgi:type IV pilus assembly protein PilO
MPDLRQTRKGLKTALAIMAGVDLLAALLYFSPLVGSAESRRMEMNLLQAELTTKTRQVAPLKDLPQKVVLASHQITDFYTTRFPRQDSQILTEFGKLTSTNGVTIETVRYTPEEEAEEGGLQRVEIEANLGGSYSSLARFINALERDQMFFIINSVTLGGLPQGQVRLNMRLETYLKAGT